MPHRVLIKALEVIDYQLLYSVMESPHLVEDDVEQQMVKDIQNGHSGEWLEVTYYQHDFSKYSGDAD